MNELEKLYNALVAGGYYTKSFGEFQTQYNDPSYREKVFNVVSREGLYTKSREEFDVKYSPDSFPAEQEVITEEGVVETDQSMRPDLKKKTLRNLYRQMVYRSSKGLLTFLTTLRWSAHLSCRMLPLDHWLQRRMYQQL